MPSFADIKAKAAKTANNTVEKAQNMKDRKTSVSLKKTNWDPYSGKPPPPPPPPKSLVNSRTKPEIAPMLPPPRRTSAASSSLSTPGVSRAASISPAPPLPSRTSSSSSAGPPLPRRNSPSVLPPSSRAFGLANTSGTPSGPPPPVARATKPVLAQRDSLAAHEDEEQSIDWTKLSSEDKEVFFSWLDEFFSSYLKIKLAPRPIVRATQPLGNSGGPPPVKAASKPTSRANPVLGNNLLDLVLSHPPATVLDSAAADLAEFFSPGTRWSEAWYHESGIPPPLKGNTNVRYVSSWESIGNIKTARIGVLFSDLSIFWGFVKYAMNDPENERSTKRGANYLSRPTSLDRNALEDAHATYGETIASFAESFLGTGTYCARGECWDLANEALKYFNDYDYIPKPVPSISRTHGHLIYEGRASNHGRQTIGRWRGGDDRIRRGDIIEWRRVTIAAANYTYILGDPDHTAVIVRDAVPLVEVRDGLEVVPSQLGTITVVEQSAGSLPKEGAYNLQGLQEGEMWIYRPISMEVYLGIKDLTPAPPDGIPHLRTIRS
ncbi:hypothetical protein BKA70DRAFT_1296728 [Coprinopsis sp. MPI-PUGE-AT-0042]|nr:hypothetical protein BKA70DRAFT_1296728 [Coprinopsis sp. MPI-PUGE-AT-0042]